MNAKRSSITHVAVVEDNRDLRHSIREILNRADGMICTGDYGSAEEALAELPALEPEVVLMDINLPGMDGVECVRELADRLPDALIVMLTIQSNIGAVFESLRAGACGYLRKPVCAQELIAAVKEVASGGSPMTAGVARQVVKAFKEMPPPGNTARSAPDLTDRERQVLEMLTEGCLYKEIAEKLAVSWHTVHNHIRHIYEKLQVRSRAQAIAKFRGG